MTRIVWIVSAGALAVFLVATVWVGRLDRSGPPHADLVLDGGVPATVYLPGDAPEGPRAFLDPPPPGDRPPVVVVLHGYSGDRASMSGISRRIAASGYAVLNIDARGHGPNRNPFSGGWARADILYTDLAAAVDFARGWPFVDGSRIAVLGHSMGAGAVLDYATRDSGIDAAVMIAGGWRLEGPYRPSNALFLFADRDPDWVKVRSRELAARLAGVAEVELSRSYGRADRMDAVRVVEIAGVNHQTIVWSPGAVAEVVAWLDGVFGVERTDATVPDDPRMPVLLLLGVAAVLVMPGLGLLAGRLVPARSPLSGDGRGRGLLALGAALALTMPLLAAGTPGVVLSVEVADAIVAHFALAGVALLVGIRLRRPALFEGIFRDPLATLGGAAVAVVAVFVLTHPLGVVVHRTTFTPERLAVWLASAVGFFPLALAFQLLLRRGANRGAALAAVAGRLLVLIVLLCGAAVGILSPVVFFMVPTFALIFFALEILAASLYAASHNLLAIALVDAAWLAIVAAAIMPIRV